MAPSFTLETDRILFDTTIIFIAGLLFALLARRVRLSPLFGYLIAGLVIGPYGFGLVRSEANIRFLADVGVVLLMFAVGVQLSLRQLLEIRTIALVVGLGHTLIAIVLGLAVSILLGVPPFAGLVLGYAIALCSSVVLVRLLSDSDGFHTIIGRQALGISILQDLLAVVLISTLPLLGHSAAPTAGALAASLLKAVLFILGIIVLARWGAPLILNLASVTGSREIFSLTVVVLSLGGAMLSGIAGFSFALGAFLAGLVVSESFFSSAVLAEVMPLRDVFGLLFFISLGMLVNPAIILQSWALLLALLLTAVQGKAALIFGLQLSLRQHPYVALITGVSLAQIGEFSFIIAREAQRLNVISPTLHSIVLAVAIISIALNPLLLLAAQALYRRLRQAGWTGYPQEADIPIPPEELSVLLCGYGRVGHYIVQALDTFRVPMMVIDMNRHAVESLHRRGIRAVYGDAANARLLERINAGRYVLGVIAIAEADSVYTVAQHLRRLCPSMRLLLRSHSDHETALYQKMGVEDVVHVELEASLAFVREVLTTADVDTEIVSAYLQDIRDGYYEALRPRKSEE